MLQKDVAVKKCTASVGLVAALACVAALGTAAQQSATVERFPFQASRLRLARPVRPGAFFDVVGRRAAALGYEARPLEVWVYPLKLVDDFRLSFALEGYPLEIEGLDVVAAIDVRPEATILTYSHAAFTVRQVMYVPVDEPGLVMLLDVETTLPIRITAAFRPRLRLMWPAGLMTPYTGWDADTQMYSITEETRRFAGVIGSPGSRDLSLMPHQEEPRDVPLRFVREVTPEEARRAFIPIIVAGSVKGHADAAAAYRRLLAGVRAAYESSVQYYKRLLDETTDVRVPDERVASAFDWAKVGVDKGFATNPLLGAGLVAGFRTSGESERPGFAWFFGRDALWTTLAITSYGDFASTRTALEFLRKFQREDGKIPHEVSQSATLVPWFTDYPYPWASADATPLYVIAHADYWKASGDRAFLDASWDSIVRAYRFTAHTDSDGNSLIENTGVGHGWVEGGALYPPHEEIYMQGLWIEATRGIAELAELRGDTALASEAREASRRTLAATEKTYWLGEKAGYAFATARPKSGAIVAEPGPRRPARQKRLEELRDARIIDEDTVLPAVPLWWGSLQEDRAQLAIDRLGSGAIATDWGARILSARSRLYDPLSYHYGSVWPLFTGWSSMAAYRYGRPHVGYQALASNALLTFTGALGYVTELLSGDFAAPFGRSSHHQIWSEAMVITPVVRGLFGVEVADGGASLHVRPQLPPDWDRASLRRIAVGSGRCDVTIEQRPGRTIINVERQANAAGRLAVILAPALPLDARISRVSLNGQPVRFDLKPVGDVQRVDVRIPTAASKTTLEVIHSGGSDVYARIDAPEPGATSTSLRIIRSHAESRGLRLTLEGLGSHTYTLRLRTSRELQRLSIPGVRIDHAAGTDPTLTVTFEGPADEYVRREIVLLLAALK